MEVENGIVAMWVWSAEWTVDVEQWSIEVDLVMVEPESRLPTWCWWAKTRKKMVLLLEEAGPFVLGFCRG